MTSVPAKLWIDTRWDEMGGIGRFARESRARLRPGWYELRGGKPSSPIDTMNVQRARLSARDLVFSPGYNAGITRARQLLTLHDLMHLTTERSATKAAYYELVVKPTVRATGVVLTVSETSKSLISEWLGDSLVDIVVVGNGISAAFSPAIRSTVRKHENMLLYVGNVKPHKNFPAALSCLSHLDGWSLTVVTSTPVSAVQQAESYGLRSRVRILSGLSDEELAREYARATVVLLPSFEEGFGFPAVEATAVGTPVLYWERATAVKEVVGGIAVPVADASDGEGWADGVRCAASAPDFVPTLAYANWRARFRWDAVAKRVADAIDALSYRPRYRS